MHRSASSGVIDASPEACYEAIAAFETYPEWQTAVARAEVLGTDGEGGGELVEFEIDLKLGRIRYRLRYHHDPPHRLWWDYVEGDPAAIEGEFRFEPAEGGTRASYELGVDPGVPVPGPLARGVAGAAMGRAIEDLRKRVEGG